MRHLPIRHSILLLVALLFLSACAGPEATPLPEPLATPAPATATVASATATPQPSPATATPEPMPAPPTAVDQPALPVEWVTFRAEEGGLVIHHPAQWEVTGPDAAVLAALFAQAEGEVASESMQALLRQLTSTPGALERFAALGFLFNDPTLAQNRFVSNFTAIVVPAEGLTLTSYTQLVGAQLGSLEAFSLESAQVESALRPGGLDVASLRYTIDGAAVYRLPEGTIIRGWQVAFFDPPGERLLILSFTAISDNFVRLEETFRQLLLHVEFE